MAKKYGVPLVVRSSLNNSEGTVVKEEVTVERMLISGVALDTEAVRIAVIGLKDVPGMAFKLFDVLAKKHINVDVILLRFPHLCLLRQNPVLLLQSACLSFEA